MEALTNQLCRRASLFYLSPSFIQEEIAAQSSPASSEGDRATRVPMGLTDPTDRACWWQEAVPVSPVGGASSSGVLSPARAGLEQLRSSMPPEPPMRTGGGSPHLAGLNPAGAQARALDGSLNPCALDVRVQTGAP